MSVSVASYAAGVTAEGLWLPRVARVTAPAQEGQVDGLDDVIDPHFTPAVRGWRGVRSFTPGSPGMGLSRSPFPLASAPVVALAGSRADELHAAVASPARVTPARPRLATADLDASSRLSRSALGGASMLGGGGGSLHHSVLLSESGMVRDPEEFPPPARDAGPFDRPIVIKEDPNLRPLALPGADNGDDASNDRSELRNAQLFGAHRPTRSVLSRTARARSLIAASHSAPAEESSAPPAASRRPAFASPFKERPPRANPFAFW
ncbi:uncharacterized protein AMSG_07632 [Thecamonas trahens ATCC 50062]|uniref:Uncharacterized protein n=1 Tax=Thecamonas trahens ATCC 50062 TaxID=461836 RepID=A0A0L0DJD7_THETB|nr:hypothetical protein AMSG_07632 [Thecamonas trahens ATCC 50062]KNC51438.1 hypothetical protein AMSG_07632 [Thecamonas trahens ATCC 50062]|eukprot:XP_013756101.1 hypothetical protein AMSG_07632 [Thecamonas trahens ATCC 50062]